MRENHASIKEVLERSGYSEKAIREILAWYLPSKRENRKNAS
jgi:hypothetical protein